MSPYRRILLVMTKVQAHAAMHRAMALARASGALLHVLKVSLLLVPAEARAMPANTLVAVDVAKADLAQQALNHALVEAGRQLASPCNGQVHLLSVYDLPLAMLANPDLAAPWAEQVRESLQLPFDELADIHGIPYAQRYFIEGAPLRVIQSLVPTLKIDVVVVGVVQPRRWAKLIGDTTERLVDDAPCSVLAVRPPSAD